MLFFRCCVKCHGDLLLQADAFLAHLKCLRCGMNTEIPANTHLYQVLCKEEGVMAKAEAA